MDIYGSENVARFLMALPIIFLFAGTGFYILSIPTISALCLAISFIATLLFLGTDGMEHTDG